VSRPLNQRNSPNTEVGFAALELVKLSEGDPALLLMRHLQNYVIYSPTTPVLRARTEAGRQPLGLSGEGLAEAVRELISLHRGNEFVRRVCGEALHLIGWAKEFGTEGDSPSTRRVTFFDKYIRRDLSLLSGLEASEGALYVLFLAALAALPKAPSLCAIDNAEQVLNPGLATALTERFADWILSSTDQRQVLVTSHNPAVLDGLPLQDNRVRLFTVDRDNMGKTIVKRVVVTKKLLDMAAKGWTLSRLWTNKLIGGMPDV
jgi:predicted ATPase